jgi:hypothetical protein
MGIMTPINVAAVGALRASMRRSRSRGSSNPDNDPRPSDMAKILVIFFFAIFIITGFVFLLFL